MILLVLTQVQAAPAFDLEDAALEGALASDDACDAAHAGSSCDLSLRQLRGERLAASVASLERQARAEDGEAITQDPPEAMPGFPDVVFLNLTGFPDDLNETWEAGLDATLGSGPDGIGDPSQNCASPANSAAPACYLYHACAGQAACVINNYLVVPGAPLRGMEDINGTNAAHWDFLFTVAQGQCGAESCVLITNPVGHRTQHQMHIHYRQYNADGAALKKRLEKALCHSTGWRGFSECGHAKAKLFNGLPGVFSAVDAAYGGGSMANIGITVWFTTACGGGLKTMVLATVGCSIEHSISAR